MNNRAYLQSFVACLLFGLLGFLGNWFKLEIFFNLDFLFGSFFVMLAILMTGQIYGVIAGFIAATCTYFLWNHPWAVIVMTGEAVFVGSMYSRNKGNLVIYDMIYWLCIGMPLVYLFYHYVMAVQIQSTTFIMLKQSMNGVFNALMANLVYTVFSLRKNGTRNRIGYSQLIFTVMVSLVLLPAMIFLVVSMRMYLKNAMESLAKEVSNTCEMSRNSVTGWIKEHHQTIQTLSALIGDPGKSGFSEMQRYVETVKAAAPSFLRMLVINKDSNTVAGSPLVDENGKSILGVNFSDRPYISIIKQNKSPYIPDVVMGKIGNPNPIVMLLAPFVVQGEYKGYCAGVIETSSISNILVDLAGKDGINITVVDGNGRVITGTAPGLKVMDRLNKPYAWGAQARTSEVVHWIPDLQPGISVLQRWRDSVLVETVALSPNYSWQLIVESPVLPVLENITRVSILGLSLLTVLTLFTVVLSRLFTEAMVSGTVKLMEISTAFPKLIGNIGQIEWPTSKIIELQELSNNFQYMAHSLSDSFQQQKFLNDSLEQRVKERTNELMKSEADLKEAHERLDSIIESLPDPTFVIDMDGKVIAWNKAVEELTGVSKTSILHKGNHEYALPFFGERRATLIDIALQGELKPSAMGYDRIQKKDDAGYRGEIFAPQAYQGKGAYLATTASVLKDSFGNVTGAIETIRDITERKRMEQALSESENKFKTFSEQSLTGMYLLQDAAFRYVNPRMAQMFGYTVEEYLKMPLNAMICPEDVGKVEEQIAKRMSGEVEAVHYTFRGLHKSGQVLFLEVYGSVIVYGGRPATMGNLLDITSRVRAEQELLKQHELQRVLLSTIPAYVYIKDTNSTYLAANKEFGELSATPENEIPGKTDYDFFPKKVAEAFRATDAQIFATGEARLNYEERGTDSEGNEVWFTTSKCPFYGPNREIAGLVGICADITERKRSELALQKSEERYRSLFENMIDGFAYCRVILENELPVGIEHLAVNCAYEELTGLKNVIGAKCTPLIPGMKESNPELFEIYGRVASSGCPERFETYLPELEIWLNVSVYSLEKGSFVAIFDNISDRKKAETGLRIAKEELEKRVEERTSELKGKTVDLENVNIALRVLLDTREEERKELEAAVAGNLRSLISPYVEKLQKTQLSATQATYLSILQSHLKEIESRFIKKLSLQSIGLTPTEIQVAVFIRDGKTTKDIAEVLHISEKAVDFHRSNIRSKLSIKNKKENLRSHLLGLS
jgi:hypothetical protein